jgi:hypothetical protein
MKKRFDKRWMVIIGGIVLILIVVVLGQIDDGIRLGGDSAGPAPGYGIGFMQCTFDAPSGDIPEVVIHNDDGIKEIVTYYGEIIEPESGSERVQLQPPEGGGGPPPIINTGGPTCPDCPRTSGEGTVVFDCSCVGKGVAIEPENGVAYTGGIECETPYDADGYKIDGTPVKKVVNLACTRVKCSQSGGNTIISHKTCCTLPTKIGAFFKYGVCACNWNVPSNYFGGGSQGVFQGELEPLACKEGFDCSSVQCVMGDDDGDPNPDPDPDAPGPGTPG